MDAVLLEKIGNLGGLTPAVGGQFCPMDLGELNRVEVVVGAKLPETYREFLLTYGAATFYHIVQFDPLQAPSPEAAREGGGFINFFYGATSDAYSPSFSLVQAHERYKGRIPRGLIPIADDSGNQICLAIFGSETGKVFYWDHHDEDDGVDEQSPASLTEGLPRNLYLVARSFEEFLMGLTIMEW